MYDGSNITTNPRRDNLSGVISVVFFLSDRDKSFFRRKPAHLRASQ